MSDAIGPTSDRAESPDPESPATPNTALYPKERSSALSAPVKAFMDYVHPGILCNHCSRSVKGTRYQCLTCPDFDLCQRCVDNGRGEAVHNLLHHSEHSFKVIRAPGWTETVDHTPSVCQKPAMDQVAKTTLAENDASSDPQCKDSSEHDVRGNCLPARGDESQALSTPPVAECRRQAILLKREKLHQLRKLREQRQQLMHPGPPHESSNFTEPFYANGHGPHSTGEPPGDEVTLDRAELGPSTPSTTQTQRMPGAFNTLLGSPAEYVHSGVFCNFCSRAVKGIRFQCLTCPDFDLCQRCVDVGRGKAVHNVLNQVEHSFRAIPAPGGIEAPEKRVSSAPAATGSVQPEETTSSAPQPVSCEVCELPIISTHHYCLDCPGSNLCDICIVSSRNQHPASHRFHHSRQPLSSRDRIHLLLTRDKELHAVAPSLSDTYKSTEPLNIKPLKATAQPGTGTCAGGDSSESKSFPEAPVVPDTGPLPHRRLCGGSVPNALPPSSRKRPVVHTAICDMCDLTIMGVRHKCLRCPDYDVCASCFRSQLRECHPKHPFIKITEVDTIAVQPNAHEDDVSHNALCDACSDQIVGARYRCLDASCPDYDICEKCEALPIPVHPPSHPLVKLRRPLESYPGLKRVFQKAKRASPTSGHLTHNPQPPSVAPLAVRSQGDSPAPETASWTPNLKAEDAGRSRVATMAIPGDPQEHPSLAGLKDAKGNQLSPVAGEPRAQQTEAEAGEAAEQTAQVSPVSPSVPNGISPPSVSARTSPSGPLTYPGPPTEAPRSLNVYDALSFLHKVKLEYPEGDGAGVYNKFLDTMKAFREGRIDTPGVVDQVSTLFCNRPSLIEGFNTFLPLGYRIQLVNSSSLILTSPSGVTTRSVGGNALLTTPHPGLSNILPSLQRETVVDNIPAATTTEATRPVPTRSSSPDSWTAADEDNTEASVGAGSQDEDAESTFSDSDSTLWKETEAPQSPTQGPLLDEQDEFEII